MSLATTLVSRALKLVGVLASGETADANDALDCVDDINDMIDQWSLEDLMLYYDKVESVPLVAGQNTYLVGPTGTALVTVRPIEILLANYRDADNLDTPVSIVPMDSYERLVQKTTTQTIPSIMAYQPTNPDGTIYVWPTPSSGTLRVMSNNLLTRITDLSTDMILPIGYNECFLYGLAERLCIKYGRKDMLDDIANRALMAKQAVKRKNKKKNVMFFDPALISGRMGGTYNPYTDR